MGYRKPKKQTNKTENPIVAGLFRRQLLYMTDQSQGHTNLLRPVPVPLAPLALLAIPEQMSKDTPEFD